jgi:phage terminase small subunit
MNAKQKRFAEEYLIDLNATAAYKRAGYTAKGASSDVNASKLLRNPKVAAFIQSAMDKRSEDLGIDAKYVLQTIKNTIERCSQAEQIKGPDGTVSGEYKFDSTAVLKGAELLGKHLKMFTDKAEVEHKGNVILQLSNDDASI